MTVSTEDVCCEAPGRGESRRAAPEFVLEVLFRPLSRLVVPVLGRLGVPPPLVVLANAGAGLAAALALATGELVPAALLLQVKTLLDNADGELARITKRVTLAGRYLDTEADIVVNAAVFVALGSVTGKPVLAVGAFVALTLVLAVDFNLTHLFREYRGQVEPVPRRTGGSAEHVLESIYGAIFAPLDRVVRAFSAHRFARLVAPEASVRRVQAARLAYVDRLTVSVLANLGLTTQLFVLSVCLALGFPEAYLWLVLACVPALVALQLRAEARARAALRTRRAA